MKYVFHDGSQIYVPESNEENRLVRDRVYDLLQLECSDVSLWEMQCDDEGWYPAGCILPFTESGGPIGQHVENLGSRPDPQFVVTVDLALPVDYENQPLVCRRDRRMDAEVLTAICKKMFGRYRFDETALLPTVTRLFKGIKTGRGRKRLPDV